MFFLMTYIIFFEYQILRHNFTCWDDIWNIKKNREVSILFSICILLYFWSVHHQNKNFTQDILFIYFCLMTHINGFEYWLYKFIIFIVAFYFETLRQIDKYVHYFRFIYYYVFYQYITRIKIILIVFCFRFSH